MSTFQKLSSLHGRDILGGAIQGRYVHLTHLTVGEVELAAGTRVPPHTHPHEQVTYVIEGRFEFTVGDETTVLEAGDAAIIPAGVTHGGRTITACRVIDAFSPARDDYR